MLRTELISHILACDELSVTCRCHQFGCDWKGPKKDIGTHNESCSYLKLEPFLKDQVSRVTALEKENSELRNLIQGFHAGLETVAEQVNELSQPSSRRTLVRPNQEHSIGTNENPIATRYFSEDLPAASLERVRADHQRLRFELMSLSSTLVSLEQKQNLALTTECLSLRDEMQDLRFSIQALKVELDDLSRERQNTLSALAALARSASSRASRNSPIPQGKPAKLNDYKL
ncbi:hypothetical protein DSO57_1026047 [Entomophthora muscae]|uniref:Uncharacterized protein n=1 Tax=Entomophthora muscae TaxID=34485 RepID=A0ACC2U0P0_9FUNG|nr:hypothetical protein DSO57_1026047 [Entomophthora muscae]